MSAFFVRPFGGKAFAEFLAIEDAMEFARNFEGGAIEVARDDGVVMARNTEACRLNDEATGRPS